MSDWLKIVILAVVQGVTEFLPISSSGHLAILQRLLGISEDNLLISIVLHAGSLASILVFYARDLLRLLREKQWRVIALVALGTLPLLVLGLPLHKLLGLVGMNLWWVAGGYLVSFVLLIFVHSSVKDARPLTELPYLRAVAIGFAQCLAVLPGVSRSGSTISVGARSHLNGVDAARYSFFLGIPAIAGATVVEMKAILLDGYRPAVDAVHLALGFGISFAVGLVALAGLIRILQHRRLYFFGWYCLAAAVFAAILQLFMRGN